MNEDRSIRSFVRNTWILLSVQMLAAIAALAVTYWASLQVKPLLAQREQLEADIAADKAALTSLKTQNDRARAEIVALQKQTADARAELKDARDATPLLTRAINAFHRKDYAAAVAAYDQVLHLDPANSYVYNLKSYSQFKAADLTGAITTLSRSLEMNPAYEWGYFDLARYQCAAGQYAQALETIKAAIARRGDSIKRGATYFLEQDGEFSRLCKPVVAELRRLAN